MFETFAVFTQKWLDPIGVWVGLLSFIPLALLWWDHFYGRSRRHGKWLERAKSTTGKLPVVLIVDLLAGKDIAAAVRHFMAQHEQLRDIPDERLIKINRDHDLTPEDMPQLAREVQDSIAQVLRHGADELHVFIAGPGCANALVGAELSNISCRVLLYQNDRASNRYVNFGPVRHPRF